MLNLKLVRFGIVEEYCAWIGSDIVLITNSGVNGAVHGSKGHLTSNHGAGLPKLWQEVHTRRTPGGKEINDDWLSTCDNVRKV